MPAFQETSCGGLLLAVHSSVQCVWRVSLNTHCHLTVFSQFRVLVAYTQKKAALYCWNVSTRSFLASCEPITKYRVQMGVRMYICMYVGTLSPCPFPFMHHYCWQSIKSNMWKGLGTRHPSSTCMHAIRISREMLYVAIVNFGGFENLEKLTFNSGPFSAG